MRAQFFFTCWLAAGSLWASGMQPEQLRCELLENPLGIDAAQPRLSWVLNTTERGQRQTAYEILAASNAEDLLPGRAELWDSGKVVSDESAFIPYAGKPLASGKLCFWRVRVWDKAGKLSGFSANATFETGLLKTDDWQAQWIGNTTNVDAKAAPIFRREFSLDGKIKQARAYFCGLGYGELRVNGQKAGDHFLDPGYTRYDKRVLYVTQDITPLLKRGRNTIGVMLGNGWFNVQAKAAWDFDKAPWRAAPRLLCSVHIEFEDGRKVVVGSDGNWKCTTGPIVFNTIYGGEIYDARLETPGWDSPGFDDSAWPSALLVAAPKGRLVAQAMPPIKADGEFSPARLSEPKPGIFVFDFGQNLAGYADLKVRGPAGARITMKYGERLQTNGMLDQRDIAVHLARFDASQRFQTDTYILKGQGTERWHSRFAYYGFQYVEVTGFPGKPDRESLRAVATHSAVPVAGNFECSNPLLNKIWRAARWSYLNNLQGIPTDCPHREKNGWTGDAQLACEQGLFNFDGASVYEKWLNDLDDEQQPGGELPGIVPTSGWGYQWGNGPAWDSAFLLIPLYLYQYQGDAQPLRAHYDGMKRYVDYLTRAAKDGIVSIGLNDWAPYQTATPADITSTAYYYRDALVVSLAASLCGKSDDAARYAELAGEIKTGFNRHFYNPTTGLYGNGSQTSLSCALYQGLAEPQNSRRVLESLIANIEARNHHIDAGILGSKYLLNALTEGGRSDVAYRVAAQKDLPSWGWWIEQGATTLWEEWNGTSSRNHIMFGEVAAWFYKALAGINPDPAAPGFKHFFIRPRVVGDLTFARAEYNSIHGKIVSNWRRENGKFNLQAVIPPNTTATIYVPAAAADSVKEGRGAAAGAKGLQFLKLENGCAVFEALPGSYHFVSQ
jgi:alpha-L-rhamnosidase